MLSEMMDDRASRRTAAKWAALDDVGTSQRGANDAGSGGIEVVKPGFDGF